MAGAGGPRLCGDFSSAAVWIYRVLRAVHILDGRLRVGRSLRFNGRRYGGAAITAAASAVQGESGALGVEVGDRVGGSEPGDSGCVAGVLAASGDLPDGNVWASDVRDCAAVQEYCGVCAGKDGNVGTEY